MPILVVLVLPMFFDWKVLKSEHFTVMYRDEVGWQAQQVLKQAEIHKPYVDRITGNETARPPFVVEDIGMYANGFADPFMNNIHIYPYTPGPLISIEGNENWIRTVTVHEYTHGAHLTLARGSAGVLRSLFGSVFSPNMYSPGWLIEGPAVYAESRISPYEGRLNEGFYASYMNTLVQDGKIPSLITITNQPLQFPYDTYYLYGGIFFDFLADRYGLERFARFSTRNGAYPWAPLAVFFPCIGIDAAARHAYGRSFDHLYEEWRSTEYENAAPEDGGIEQVTRDGWYISGLAEHQGTLYYVRSSSYKVDAFDLRTRHELIAYDAARGQQTVLKHLPSATVMPVRIHQGRLYVSAREISFGMANTTYNGYGFVHSLSRIDLATGATEALFTGRMRAFCVISEDSILYSVDRDDAYGSTLWMLTSASPCSLCSFDLLIEELLCAHGHITAIGKAEFSNTDIYTFNIHDGSLTCRALSPWTEAYLQPIDDHRIGFTSNASGTCALYELDLSTGMVARVAHPGYAHNGVHLTGSPERYFFIGLTGQGFDIFNAPVRRETNDSLWSLSPDVPATSLPDMPLQDGSYADVIRTLLPRIRTPLMIPANDDLTTWHLGALVMGQDAVQENTYFAILAYNHHAREPYVRSQWQCRVFSPLVADVSYEEDEVRYGAGLPVYSRLRYGLTGLSLSLAGRSFDDFERIEVTPGISCVFTFPMTTVRWALALPYERIAWGSQIDRHAQYARITGQQVLAGGSMECTITAFRDADSPDRHEIELRGMDPLLVPEGFGVQAEYAHRLFALRRGSWNPNFYLEDVFAALFFDYGHSRDGYDAFSYGIEVRPELKLGFGYIRLVPCAGCARTSDGDFSWYIRLLSRTDAPYLRLGNPL